MKKQFQHLKLFLPALLLLIASHSSAQKQFTHTATKANNSCNGDCTLLDVPELNNNPAAIIFVTPITDNGVNLNPHPIGVFYFQNRWRIFNLDQRYLSEGAKFNVEYVVKADSTHIQYLIKRENLQKDGSAIIDHPALNNNPKAIFQLFHSWNPEVREAGTANREEISLQYNLEAGKWFVSNTNKKFLPERAAYNVVISSGGRSSESFKAVQIKELITTTNPNSVSGPVMAMYMTAWADGIKLPGDNLRAAYLDKAQIFGFNMGAATPMSVNGGKRVYEPITIKIETGLPPTASFFNAFVKNQSMVFTIEAFTVTQNGIEALNYTIKLSVAHIVSFKQIYEDQSIQFSSTQHIKHYDEIKIVFTQIELTNSNGIQVIDNL